VKAYLRASHPQAGKRGKQAYSESFSLRFLGEPPSNAPGASGPTSR